MHPQAIWLEERARACARLPRVLALLAALSTTGLIAQTRTLTLASLAPQATLRETFESAWPLQPEAKATPYWREALHAQAKAASAWTPEPAALELSLKSDRATGQHGAREYEAGLSVPLWLPRERNQTQALADAQSRLLDSRLLAARLSVAATVRETWWSWLRSTAELASATDQRDQAQRIFMDVDRRVRAGDLARADRHQAEGALAAAQAAVAQAEGAVSLAFHKLAALLPPGTKLDTASGAPEPEPPLDGEVNSEEHADLQESIGRARVADGMAALAHAQSRGNPEIKFALTRDRGSFGEPYQQTLSLGLRIPLGAGARHTARTTAAQAEAVLAQTQVEVDRARVRSEIEAARAKVRAAKAQVTAAAQRAQLAQETRSFFDKAFQLGETDLPNRLRVEAEAAEATRQAQLSHIELGAAISALRQAMGLLPQ